MRRTAIGQSISMTDSRRSRVCVKNRAESLTCDDVTDFLVDTLTLPPSYTLHVIITIIRIIIM